MGLTQKKKKLFMNQNFHKGEAQIFEMGKKNTPISVA